MKSPRTLRSADSASRLNVPIRYNDSDMPRTDHDILTDLLRACFSLAPKPLYPASFAQEKGVDRATLDSALDELRLKGLVRLTEWVQGQGQGYTLTPAGL